MYCTSCGRPLDSKAETCPNCRAPAEGPAQQSLLENGARNDNPGTGWYGESAEYRREELFKKRMKFLKGWGFAGLVVVILALAYSGTRVGIPVPVLGAIGSTAVLAYCVGTPLFVGWRYRKTVSKEEAACPSTVPTIGQQGDFAQYQLRMQKKLIKTPVLVWSLLAGIPTAAVTVYLLATTLNSQNTLTYTFCVLGGVWMVDYVVFLIIWIRGSRLYRKAVREYEAAHLDIRINNAQPMVRGDETPRGPATGDAWQAAKERTTVPSDSCRLGQRPGKAKCPFCASTGFYVGKEAGIRRCSECGSVLPSCIKR